MNNSTNGSDYKPNYGYLYKNLESYFLVWYLPLVIVVGTLGGIFCLLFLFKSKLFPKIILIWLVSICMADLLILQTDATRMMIKVWTRFDIRDQGLVICRLHNYLSNFFIYWSAYNQSAMSLQRLYFIIRPLEARVFLTFRRTFIFWALLLLLILVPNVTYLIYWKIGKRGDCEPVDNWFYYATTLCDLVVSGIIPLATMTLATILISIRVLRMNEDRLMEGNNCAHSGVVSNRRTPSDSATHVTKLLVSMNLAYMFTTYPLLIYLMHLNFGLQNKVGITIPQKVHKFYYYMFRALCYLNSSTNWIFYCAAGRVFRKRAMMVILNLLGRRVPQNSHSMTNTNTVRERESALVKHSANTTPMISRSAGQRLSPSPVISRERLDTPVHDNHYDYPSKKPLIVDSQC